jgi:acetolactate synthase-1/2/3 large subunit
MAEMLRGGTSPMFGVGGFQLLPFYDALHQLGLRHYLINDGATGVRRRRLCPGDQPAGVCDSTLGPGAATSSPACRSLNAGTPMVAIAGFHRAHSGRTAQECRQVDILRPAVKELIRVELTSRIPN